MSSGHIYDNFSKVNYTDMLTATTVKLEIFIEFSFNYLLKKILILSYKYIQTNPISVKFVFKSRKIPCFDFIVRNVFDTDKHLQVFHHLLVIFIPREKTEEGVAIYAKCILNGTFAKYGVVCQQNCVESQYRECMASGEVRSLMNSSLFFIYT